MTTCFWFESSACMTHFMLPHLPGSFNLHVCKQVVCLRVLIYHLCQQDSWEIVEGLRGGFSNVLELQKQEGYMLKRRKWPMKGWHKVRSNTPEVPNRDMLPYSSLSMPHEVFLDTWTSFPFPGLPYALWVFSAKNLLTRLICLLT